MVSSQCVLTRVRTCWLGWLHTCTVLNVYMFCSKQMLLTFTNAPDIHFMVVLLTGFFKAKVALIMRMSSTQRAHANPLRSS